MLTDADRAIAHAEPDMPGLGAVLDGPGLLELLGDVPGLDLRGSRVTYLRYKPRTSLLAGLVLETGTGPLPAYAAAVPLANATSRLERMTRLSEHATWGPAVRPAAGVGLAPPGCDGRLPGLRHPALSGDRAGARTVRYKPERRWVGAIEGVELIKVHRVAETSTLLLRHQTLAGAGLPVPALTRVVPEAGLLATAWVDGTPLDAVPPASRPWEEIGALLARVHATRPGSAVARLRAPAEHVELGAAARAVANALPAAEPLARWVAERCATVTPGRPRRVVHGDFSADQLLLDRRTGGLWLTDTDRVHLGDPAADLGSLLAADAMDGLRAGRPIDGTAENPAVERLLAGYRTVAGRSATELVAAGVRRQTAAGLLRRAIEPFRHREQDWPELVRASVRSAADRIAR